MASKRLEKEEEQQAEDAWSEEDLAGSVKSAPAPLAEKADMIEDDEAVIIEDEEGLEALEEEEEEAAEDAETSAL